MDLPCQNGWFKQHLNRDETWVVIFGLFDQENGRKTKPSQVNLMMWHHFMGKPS